MYVLLNPVHTEYINFQLAPLNTLTTTIRILFDIIGALTHHRLNCWRKTEFAISTARAS